MSFKVPPTNVKCKEAGYRRVLKPRNWRRELASESEEVFVEHETVFDKR